MLRNKYVIAVLCVLLLAVLLYDLSFFRKRGAGPGPAAPAAPAPPAALARTAAAAGTAADYRPQWRRDPFRHAGGAPRTAPAARSGGDLRLEGTMSRGGTAYALINGRIYGAGDRVDGSEIVKIDDLAVTMRGAGGTRVLRILRDGREKE
jgi:hypothetical protein